MKEDLGLGIPKKIAETFETMFGVSVTQVKDIGIGFKAGDIVGTVILQEAGLKIQIRFTFTRTSLQPLLSKIYDGNITAAGEGIEEDAVCEIINIVCTGLKTQLNSRGHKINIGIPTIDYNFKNTKNNNTVYSRFDFALDGGRFSVDIDNEKMIHQT